VAHGSGAFETKVLKRVTVDTSAQEKAIAHPADARRTHRATKKFAKLTQREEVELRQSYLRMARRAAIMVGRHTHAYQLKRAAFTIKSGVSAAQRTIRYMHPI
jgi:IS5 family transposase